MKKTISMSTLFLLIMLLLPTAFYGFFLSEVQAQEKDLQQPPVLQGLSGTKEVSDRRLKPVTRVRIPTSVIQKKLLPQLRPVTVADPPEPEGPDPGTALDLADIIEDPALLYDLSQACGWESHLIFQDKAAGHVFYYLPREILLVHSEAGYGLSVQYNHLAEPGQPSVMVTAELAAPHREGDVMLLRAILREALGLGPSDLLDLRSIKGLGATVDFEAVAAGLSLSPDCIHVYPPASLRQPFRLTLSLTQDEVEEVLAQIAREGLSGRLWVQVDSESVPVPIRIRYDSFSGNQVKGFDDWSRGKPSGKLVNLTSFPLIPEEINAYRMRGSKLERITRELKESKPIPPKAERIFRLPEVGAVLGHDVLVAWLGTSLDTTYEAGLKAIDQEVRRGVALAPASPVNLEAIPAIFSEFGIYKLVIRLRSPYFTAGKSGVMERELALTESENTSSGLVLYIPSDRGADPLIYQYRLLLVKESGETIEEIEWNDGRSLNLFIGSSRIESLLAESEKE
ncbi:MAG: hypothetical protein AVO39_02870 [delta proteobacterium MLS_D]|nr:MAG: hypothetical protein AVO39_02870 [delta proteobacterium MLS_D]